MTLFELVASLKLDDKEYEAGLTDAEKKAYSAGQKIGNGLQTIGGGVGKAVSAIGTIGGAALNVGATAVKGISTAVAATSAAITPIVKQAVSAYGEQEQLVGGMVTLFKDDSNTMIEYANNAYKTAGMSANEYMQTAIESSAAMINSLGGDTKMAAEMTNMAITDMSDNANKMGTDIKSLQNAYRGFSRGNFTMLDNLSLGFSGTKEGMQQLLDKAEEISHIKYDISSYADIVDAIHVVQTEMDISGISAEEAAEAVAKGLMTEEEAFEAMGTTAKEASGTITGSVGSMKAAWQNLLAGLGSGQNIEPLINNLVASVEGSMNNLLPVIERALNGVVDLIGKLAPIIAERLPALLNQLVPPLINAATQLITVLGQNLPTMIETILPPLLQAVTALIVALAQNLPQILQVLITQLPTIVSSIGRAILEAAPALLEVGKQLLLTLWQGFKDTFPEAHNGLMEFIDKVKEIWQGLKDAFNAALEWLSPVIEGVKTFLGGLREYISAVIEFIGSIITGFIEKHKTGIDMFISTIKTIIEIAVNTIKTIVSTNIENIKTVISTVLNVIGNLFKAFASVLKGDWGAAWDYVKQAASSAVDGVKNIFSNLKNALSNILSGIVSSMRNWGADMINSFVSGIQSKISAVTDAVSGVASKVKSFLHFSEPDVGPLADFSTYAPDMMKLFAKGIADNTDVVTDQIQKSFDFGDMITAGGINDGTMGAGGSRTLNNAPVINVYGAEGQDVRELANIVADVINNQYERQALAWGNA